MVVAAAVGAASTSVFPVFATPAAVVVIACSLPVNIVGIRNVVAHSEGSADSRTASIVGIRIAVVRSEGSADSLAANIVDIHIALARFGDIARIAVAHSEDRADLPFVGIRIGAARLEDRGR